MRPFLPCRSLLYAALALTLAACTPALDWREVRSEDGGYAILMPARPTTASRTIDLDGLAVAMTMTGAEVNGVAFAVGTAELPNAAAAHQALAAMQEALVRNMHGAVTADRTLAVPRGTQGGAMVVREIHANGPASPATHGQARTMRVRLTAVEQRVYQILISGPQNRIDDDMATLYFSSFRLN